LKPLTTATSSRTLSNNANPISGSRAWLSALRCSKQAGRQQNAGRPLRLEEPARQLDVLLRRFAAQRARHSQPPLPGRISHARAQRHPCTPRHSGHEGSEDRTGRLVDEIRHTSPPVRDANLAASPQAPTPWQAKSSSPRSAARFATSQPTRLCRQERASTVARTRFRSSWVMRSSIPAATSCCTMSAQETASRKPPNRDTWTNPPPTNFAPPRCGVSDSA